MKANFIIRFLGLFGFIVLVMTMQSCSLLERPGAVKKNQKIERELQRQADKEYEQAQRQHLKMQSDATRKMMKKMERKNKKWLKSKKH
jgi:Flp pilus assembly protein TadB